MPVIKKVLGLLDRRERWQGLAILLGVLVMAIVEVAGVLSIMPFMALVAQPERALATAWGSHLYELGGFESTNSFLFAAGTLVLAVILVANTLAATTSWAMLSYGWRLHHHLAVRVFRKYMSQPYEQHLGRNTADLSKSILHEVSIVVQGVIIPGMQAIARLVVSVGLFVLLFVVDSLLAVGVFIVLGGAYTLIYVTLRKTQAKLGRERAESSRMMFRVATEAFGGLKDIKILGREPSFIERFEKPSKEHSSQRARNATLSQVPRYLLETLAFGGLLLITLYLIAVRQDISAVIPIISLYALAAYRLMPSLQQVFLGLTQVRFNLAALDDLHTDWTSDLANNPKRRGPDASERGSSVVSDCGVMLSNIWYCYPGSQDYAVRGVSISVPVNATVALVGETGSGKTTVADIVLGLLRPESGDVAVKGRLVEPPAAAHENGVGYVPQQIFLSDDTIARNVAFGVPAHEVDMDAVDRAVRLANLAAFISNLPMGVNTLVGERGIRISGGQRQRIGIARALYSDPAVLVLDEATSALDGQTETAVMEAIRGLSRQKTMIMIAHRLSTIREVDRIYVMRNGSVIAEGTYNELLDSCEYFRELAKVSLSAASAT